MLLSKGYHVAPSPSALAFGIAAALAIFWYPLAGNLSHKRGALSVLTSFLMVRWISFAALQVMVSTSVRGFLIEASSLLTVNNWPFITTSATVATDEGTTMGLYNADTVLVNTVSALAAGLVASQWGYKGLPVLATIVS